MYSAAPIFPIWRKGHSCLLPCPDDGGSKYFRNVGKRRLYDAATQKAAIFILAAVRT